MVHGDELVGVLHAEDVSRVSSEVCGSRVVWDSMRPVDEHQQVSPDASMVDALRKMFRHGVERLLVVRGDRLQGMVTARAIVRRAELEQGAGA